GVLLDERRSPEFSRGRCSGLRRAPARGRWCRRRCTSSEAQAETLRCPGYAPEVAHYLFNFLRGDEAPGPALHEQATGFLLVRMWGIDADEPHRNAPSEAQVYPGAFSGGSRPGAEP